MTTFFIEDITIETAVEESIFEFEKIIKNYIPVSSQNTINLKENENNSNGFITSFYSNTPLRNYALSDSQKYSFLSNDQTDMQLYGWFYYGRLNYNGIPCPFFVAIQRISLTIDINLNNWEGIVAIRTPDGIYNFFGTDNVTLNNPTIFIKQNPWSVEIVCSSTSFISISSIDNVPFGTPGASYCINFTGELSNGNIMNGIINFNDINGVQNQGYGPMNFFPQWIFPNQRTSIMNNYAGIINDYLKNTTDNMNGQGSIYYTDMVLDVTKFNINIGSQNISGNSGTLWVDIIGESYNPTSNTITSNITWQFFVVQFYDSNGQAGLGGTLLLDSLTSSNILNTNTLNIATLFLPGQNPIYFPIDKIIFSVDPSSLWKSPNSGKSYYLTNIITLIVDNNSSWNIKIKSTYQNQEIIIGNNSVKYEGISDITTNNGLTMNGIPLPTSGIGWLELIPTSNSIYKTRLLH